MIDAFVSGQLSEADHDLMAHHIATCEQCAVAVAAERAVRGELAKLLVQPDALPAPSAVVSSADLSVPPVPELQLDFVLDRTSEAAGLLLPRESVREVALDQLPPAPLHSERRADRGGVAADATVHDERESPAGDNPHAAYTDDTEVAAATAAGIADSVAHAAAALASISPWEPLEVGTDQSAPAQQSLAPTETEAPAIAEAGVLDVPEAPRGAAAVTGGPAPAIAEDTLVVDETDSVQDLAVVEGISNVATEQTESVEEPASALFEDAVVEKEVAAAPIDDVAVVADGAPAPDENALAEDTGAEPIATPGSSQKPVGETFEASEKPGTAVVAVRSVPARRGRRTRLWGAAAAVILIGLASVYATRQIRSAGGTGVATAAAVQLEQVSEADVVWRTTPSVLMPVLDSAVYDRVIDVTTPVDSLADSVDTARVARQPEADRVAPPTSSSRASRARPLRRPRAAERLPQIVSDPPEADDPPPRPPPGETLPEVMRGNAPARVTTRGSAVVISGVPDVPRLLRTTTHRPRPDVAYVLREYDASAAEPAPRAGVNEYRWSDATGSRLFVLSGPVDVAELRAYARQLQTR